jgi:hypothetical protein
MTVDVAGFKFATRVSQQTPASSFRCLTVWWFQAMCDARHPIGTARVKAPWMSKGLADSRRETNRARPSSVTCGSHRERNSAIVLGDGIGDSSGGRRTGRPRAVDSRHTEYFLPPPEKISRPGLDTENRNG